jgi:hypothetical protein
VIVYRQLFGTNTTRLVLASKLLQKLRQPSLLGPP